MGGGRVTNAVDRIHVYMVAIYYYSCYGAGGGEGGGRRDYINGSYGMAGWIGNDVVSPV